MVKYAGKLPCMGKGSLGKSCIRHAGKLPCMGKGSLGKSCMVWPGLRLASRVKVWIHRKLNGWLVLMPYHHLGIGILSELGTAGER